MAKLHGNISEISKERRTMHVAVLENRGAANSSLLRYFSQQDINADRGFFYFDLHGDATPFLLRTIAAREQEIGRHLSNKLIVVAPADPEISVGFNPLDDDSRGFVAHRGDCRSPQSALAFGFLRRAHG